MSKSPIVAFGLLAASVAMKAKLSDCTVRDRLGLAIASIEWLPAQHRAQRAVVDFDAMVAIDPVRAGSDLQDFIGKWFDDIHPQKLESTLRDINSVGVYAWQKRLDLQ